MRGGLDGVNDPEGKRLTRGLLLLVPDEGIFWLTPVELAHEVGDLGLGHGDALQVAMAGGGGAD